MASKLLRVGNVRALLNDEAEQQLRFLAELYDRSLSDTVRALIKKEYKRLKNKK